MADHPSTHLSSIILVILVGNKKVLTIVLKKKEELNKCWLFSDFYAYNIVPVNFTYKFWLFICPSVLLPILFIQDSDDPNHVFSVSSVNCS